MPKTITSPVKRFPGTITLSDPLTFPLLIAYQEALPKITEEKVRTLKLQQAARTILPLVEKWNIPGFENVTAETFPSTPIISVDKLLAWILHEINGLIYEAEDPNA